MPDSTKSTPLRGSQRPRPDSHKLLGPADPDKVIGVTVIVRPRPGSPPLPDLTQWQSTPLATRRALSRAEYARAHGSDPADLQKVALFASAQDLQVVESHAGRHTVTVEGKPAQLDAAFGITLQAYEAPLPEGAPPKLHAGSDRAQRKSYTHHGYDGPLSLPSDLSEIVLGVVGLDDRIRSRRAGTPIALGTDDPPGAATISVPNLAQRYNFPTAGAKDQTIGVFAPTGFPGGAAYYRPDIVNQYFQSLPAGFTTAPDIHDVDLVISGTKYQNNPAAVQALQGQNSNLPTYYLAGQNGAMLELTQDISTSSTIAQGATVNVYFNDGSEQGWLVFLNRVLQPEGENAPSVVTVSFVYVLGDEADGSPPSYPGVGVLSDSGSIVSLMTSLFQELAAVGVDVFIALGDWGADNWFLLGQTPPSAPDGNSHVMYPGSDPWVTSCGGTVLGSTEEWTWGYAYATSSQSGFGSPTSNRAATGGGVSKTFTSPAAAPYQTAAGITGATDSTQTFQTGRGVPDVAGMVALQTFFVNSTLAYKFTGTSCVAPLYAGLAAVIKSAVGQDLGPINDTLYTLKDIAFNDITQGNNSSNDTPANVNLAISQFPGVPPYTGTTPNAPFFSAATGWDACTGLGSIDGTKLLNGIASLLYNPNFYFQVNKGSFGLDEVTINADFSNPTPLWLVLEGFTPSAVIASGIKPSVIPAVSGVTVTVGAQQPEIATALDTPQRIYFPCSISFASSAVRTIAQGGIFPPPGSPPVPKVVVLLAPSFTIADQILPATETNLTLEPGADPYFANFATNGEFYLSQDLRVFTVSPGIPALAAPIDNIPLSASNNYIPWNTRAAYTYIQTLLKHLNATYSDPSGTIDPFTLFPDQTDALSGDSSVTPSQVDPANPTGTPLANYNFAVARVRLSGAPNSNSNANVRVLFRLFASQTSDTDFQQLTYPSSSDSEGQPLSPTLGFANVTIPFFATGNYEANLDFAANSDYVAGTTSINNQPVPIGDSGQAWAYYGCYLNIYPTNNTITTTTGKPSVQSLLPSTHSCVVAQLVYDDTPYPATPVLMGPEWTSNFAQRNLQITYSDNPGPAVTHRVPQTFDTRPSPTPGTGPLENYPDELLIAWGNTPVGSTATIYWPEVASADVLALAKLFYSTHQLSATDAHTIQSTVQKGFTCVPIPTGTGPNLAGLFTVNLPQGVTAGETFTIIVRRISTHKGETVPAPPSPPVMQGQPVAMEATNREAMRNWRYVVGTFAVRIPVATAKVMLPIEENTFSIIKWRLSQMEPSNRWVPVLQRYLGFIEGRIAGLGGNPGRIWPSPWGVNGPPKLTGDRRPHLHDRGATGKVNGVAYDRFGDFEGFHLLTEHGEERIFYSREREIETLVRIAWQDRMVITVLTAANDRLCPVSVILRRDPQHWGP